MKFERFKETIERKELTPKKMQHPWATFSSIQWDGKEYRTGQLVSVYSFIYFLFSSAYSGCCVDARTRVFTQVKSQKTVPIVYGRVGRFLLYGEHKGSVFATGGEVEVLLVRRESS